jgi:hypothetical protein
MPLTKFTPEENREIDDLLHNVLKGWSRYKLIHFATMKFVRDKKNEQRINLPRIN